ncbi:Hypothetical predicted protein [Prunus dulcis]|uniref:ABC transporter domain-containing protein n=1 Tax=Prunus dulcis TaxID=3755 RepID=A0A5E4EXJ4_PRUDU|nr:Hypothetical predicted protein [Prunus dulcis]
MDGRDLKTYNLRSLRKHMALVSQEPTLFGGTIRENIVYGASNETDETEIAEAAKAANAHDFISGLKDGYDTSCGDKGVKVVEKGTHSSLLAKGPAGAYYSLVNHPGPKTQPQLTNKSCAYRAIPT